MSRPNQSMRKPVLAGIITGALAMSLSFQNCSDVNFENTPELLSQLQCDEAGKCVYKGSAVVTAGVDLPPLKMFVVVDNSYTMKANQFNLANSFDQMFASSNSSNLTPFDTTAYLFNTAQHTYGYGSASLQNLNSTLAPLNTLNSMVPADFMSQHRPIAGGGLLSGKVPGDIVGYRIAEQNDVWNFFPAPVLDYSGNAAILSDNIRKPANQPADTFKTEFQNRLKLLNPDYSPDNGSGRFFPETQDKESAMCATARVLRNSQPYLASGDQSVFLMVTDENEADLPGANCIQSVFKTDQAVVDAYCEERHTSFLLSNPNCTGTSFSGYVIDYKYNDTVPVAISLSSAVVSVTYKQTKVSFTEAGYNSYTYNIQYKKRVYASQQTSVYYCEAEVRDGVPTSQCSGNYQTVVVNGDARGNCNATATSVSGGKALLANPAPTCTFNSTYVALPRATTCTPSATCQITYPNAGSFNTTGYIASQTAANAAARAYLASNSISVPYDAEVDDTVSASNVVYNQTGSTRVVGLSCPYGAGCVSNNVARGPYVRKGDFTDLDSECQADAKKINSSAISGSATCVADIVKTDTAIRSCTNIADCTENMGSYVDNTKTSCTGYTGCTVVNGTKTFNPNYTLSFVSGQYLGAKQADGSACSTDIQAKIQSVQPKYRPGVDQCKVKNSISSTSTLNPAAGSTCQITAAALCDTADNSGIKRFCTYNETPRTAQTSSPIKEELSCNSTCADSKLNYCAGIAGSTPASKIADLIAAAGGLPAGSSCTATVVKNPLPAKKTVVASDLANACPVIGSNGLPNYADTGRTSAPYTSALPIYDYVSGSTRNPNGSYSPAKNLKQYIIDRSRELFGEGFQPIVSTFVRQPADGAGIGGSVGTDYIALSTDMNGQTTSVISGDYGAPLRELSQIIKDRVQRAFVLNQLQPGQVVHKAWMWKKSTNAWQELAPSDFNAFNKTVVIDSAVTFETGDRFRFEYW